MHSFLRKSISLLLFLFIGCLYVAGQSIPPMQDYKGRITDSRDKALQGVSISVLHSNTSVTSDKLGIFTISATPGDTLYIALDGYEEVTYALTATTNLGSIRITEDEKPIIDKSSVDLIYSRQPKRLSIASTAAVYSEDIVKFPVTSFRSTLSGRIAGLATFQTLGLPGSDGVSVSLRGQSPIVIIDGVVRGLTVFDLEEIESITAVKDALGAATLGVRGSGGALVVTTKKGNISKPRISFTAQTAFQQPIKMPKPLDAYNYARLYNEALQNDGLPTVYTDADLQGYASGSDPYKYPNVDWRKQILEKSSRMDRYTLSANGGNKFARYFVSMEHVNQGGMFKESDINKYNTNSSFKSYTIRSNVDININPKLSAGIYLLGRILDANDPGNTATGIMLNLLLTPNNAYPVYNPNGSYGGSQLFQSNIWGQTIGSGYRKNYKRDMLADVYLKRTLDEITPGLYIRASASYLAGLSETVYRTKNFAVFQRQVSSGGAENYIQYGSNTDQTNSNGMDYQNRTNYLELKLGYNRVFNKVHGIDAFVLANRDNFVNGSDLPYTISGGSGRVSYNYKEKYVVEAAFAMNGSNWYGPDGGTKYGFFPAGGLAWNIHKENFMQRVNWLSTLKLFGSFGQTGYKDPGYFTYIQRYFDGAATFFGTGAGSNTSIAEQPLANPNMSWEKANKLNVGLNAALLKDKLSFTVEYYNNKYSDLLMTRGKSTSIIGNTYPLENIGQIRYYGLELQANWQQTVRKVNYFISGNVAFQRTKTLYIDEVFRPYDWMKRTGIRADASFGYIAEGLFQSTAEANAAATLDGYKPQAGDIKFKDLNGDGVINQFDQQSLIPEKPLIIYGLTAGVSWNGFDLSVLLQGMHNRWMYIGSDAYYEFRSSYGQAYLHHLQRWTPTTAATATYPRLGIGYNMNNQATSSYWLRNGNYLRVKNLEVGYTLPVSLTRRAKLQTVRVFASGTNLFTLSPANDLDMDPEVFNGVYPLQRLLNVGINLKF